MTMELPLEPVEQPGTDEYTEYHEERRKRAERLRWALFEEADEWEHWVSKAHPFSFMSFTSVY